MDGYGDLLSHGWVWGSAVTWMGMGMYCHMDGYGDLLGYVLSPGWVWGSTVTWMGMPACAQCIPCGVGTLNGHLF